MAWQLSAMSLLDVKSCFGDWALELRVAYCDFLNFEATVLLPIVRHDCRRCRTFRR